MNHLPPHAVRHQPEEAFLVEGKYSIKELVDIAQLQIIFEKFSEATDFSIGFVAYPSQEILIKTGWRVLCTRFHRGCSESAELCRMSNVALSERLRESRQLSIQRCENGLIDAATPIIVRGKYVAYLATGQLLFEPPDIEWFKERARRFGYDEDEYLQALREVPVVTEEDVIRKMAFLSEIAVMIAELGLAHLLVGERGIELAAEKERLAVTLGSIGDGVIATDAEGRVSLLNKAGEQLTGWRQDEACGRGLDEVLQVVDERSRGRCIPPLPRLWVSDEVPRAQPRVLIARDGSERIVEGSCARIHDPQAAVLGHVLVFRDITEIRHVKDELIRVQQVESLGRLAGGVAHDFNNILTGILGNVSLACEEPLEPGAKVLLLEAGKAALRAKDLVQQLLTLSKGAAPIKRAAILSEIIKDSAAFVLRGSSTKCRFELAEDLWPVEVDPGQISQVIQNLTINADQAMPGGGEVTIAARNLHGGGCREVPLAPRPYVEIVVRDHGIGIPARDLSRIFEPYFSTKREGRGLGLFVTFTVIRNHDGFLHVESEPGKGSAFRVYLPAAEKAGRPASTQPEAGCFRGSGRILVMDDEELIRNLLVTALSRAGYAVEAASDGEAVIRRYAEEYQAGRPFDLVILDLTVPGGLGGKETVLRLREFDPAVRAVASSGYSSDPAMSLHRDYGFTSVVAKPYQVSELLRAVASAIAV